MLDNGIDLLFPSRAVEYLQKLRGDQWEQLVAGVIDLEPADVGRIAFILMMVRIGGCISCQADSFRAMRGCILCSTTTIKRHKGNDQTLIDLYNEAKKDVVKYINRNKEYYG